MVGLMYGVSAVGKNRTPVIVDGEGHPIVISSVHERLHQGRLFLASEFITLASSGTQRSYYIQPNGKSVHLRFKTSPSVRTIVTLYESGSMSASGTVVPSINRNRQSANVSTNIVHHTPTITTSGTLLGTYHIGSDKKAGGTFEEGEWILQSGTVYLLEITSQEASNNVGVEIEFYEVD